MNGEAGIGERGRENDGGELQQSDINRQGERCAIFLTKLKQLIMCA